MARSIQDDLNLAVLRTDDNDDGLSSCTDLDCQYIDVDQFQQDDTNCRNYIHLNIRSLPAKFDALKIFLSELEDNQVTPDVIMLCETWLTSNNNNSFPLHGYTLVEKHRLNKKGGGVALYVKSPLKFKIREDISLFDEGRFESIFIEIINDEREKKHGHWGDI